MTYNSEVMTQLILFLGNILKYIPDLKKLDKILSLFNEKADKWRTWNGTS